MGVNNDVLNPDPNPNDLFPSEVALTLTLALILSLALTLSLVLTGRF